MRAALVSNDLPTLTHLFWGWTLGSALWTGENLYGREEIEAFHKQRPTINLAREMLRLQVVTFEENCGSVTLEFRRLLDGIPRLGHPSQMW
ncbi:MAG: DUF3225 domain-containing protein [Thermostichus sp. DG02_3_bins_51]